MGTICRHTTGAVRRWERRSIRCGPKDHDRRLRTADPIDRTPLEVHHRKNADGLRSDRVEKRVGKAPKESTVDCASGDLACLRMLKDCIAAPLRFSKEGPAETCTFALVVLGCLIELLFGEPVERDNCVQGSGTPETSTAGRPHAVVPMPDHDFRFVRPESGGILALKHCAASQTRAAATPGRRGLPRQPPSHAAFVAEPLS